MENQIAKINGTDIVTVDLDGQVFVPIRPICMALGISVRTQLDKIKEDEILSSVGTLRVSTGADGKAYEMFCLPLMYIYGWLFSINPKNVNPEAKEAVSRYRRECYEALYQHFSAALARTIEMNNAEIATLRELNAAMAKEKEAKNTRRELELTLEKLRRSRLDPQPPLF